MEFKLTSSIDEAINLCCHLSFWRSSITLFNVFLISVYTSGPKVYLQAVRWTVLTCFNITDKPFLVTSMIYVCWSRYLAYALSLLPNLALLLCCNWWLMPYVNIPFQLASPPNIWQRKTFSKHILTHKINIQHGFCLEWAWCIYGQNTNKVMSRQSRRLQHKSWLLMSQVSLFFSLKFTPLPKAGQHKKLREKQR